MSQLQTSKFSATVPYFNDATVQEFSFQAGALGVDTTAGGGKVSVIPKDGGNRFSGSAFAAYNGENWQSDNFTPELAATGATRLVPPQDPLALARVLGELVEDEAARAELSAAAKAAAVGPYSWDEAARQTLALYEQLLEARA